MRRLHEFLDDMEVLAVDLNQAQKDAQTWGDDLLRDWLVGIGSAYAGLEVSRVTATTVSVAPGRLYQSGGKMWGLEAASTVDLAPYLPAVGDKIVAIVAYGQELGEGETTRMFLVDAATGQEQPQQVQLYRTRRVILTVVAGAEAGTPIAPAIGGQYVLIAHCRMTPTGMADNTAVAMQLGAEVQSLLDAFEQIGALRAWRALVEQDVTSLRTQIGDLGGRISRMGDQATLLTIAADVARLKETAGLPDDRASYGSDRFLDLEESDPAFAGWNAIVEEGVRFAPDNIAEFVPALLNPLDTNVKVSPGGLMLPIYDVEIGPQIGEGAAERNAEIRIAQYATQSISGQRLGLARQRTRYGESYIVCTNNSWWRSGEYDPIAGVFSRDGDDFTVTGSAAEHGAVRADRYFQDFYDTANPYWAYTSVPQDIGGRVIIETFTMGGTRWVPAVDCYLNQVGATGDLTLVITETVNGEPVWDRILIAGTLPHPQLQRGWNRIPIEPTLLEGGKKYGFAFVTAGDHYFAACRGNPSKSGTFFYAVDDQLAVVAPDYDLAIRICACRFRYTRTVVELGAWNLSGGIAAIDILAPGVYPLLTDNGVNLVSHAFEFRIGSTWHRIANPNGSATPLTGLPVLVPARIVQEHTAYWATGIQLATSRVTLSRPKTAMRYVSAIRSRASSDTIRETVTIAGWQSAQHTLTATLLTGAGFATATAPTSTTDVDLGGGRLQRTWVWELGAAVTQHRMRYDATATSALVTPLVEESVDVEF